MVTSAGRTSRWEPWGGVMAKRQLGAIVSDRTGVCTPYAMNHLQARGEFRLPEEMGPGVALFDFHALTLAAPMIPWAVYALETGRRNQIRVHLAALHCPLAGDRKYGFRARDGERFPRVMLHSWRMEFVHPLRGTPLALEAMPADRH